MVKLLYRITTGISVVVNIRSVVLSIHDDGLLHQRQRESKMGSSLLLVRSVLHSVRVKDFFRVAKTLPVGTVLPGTVSVSACSSASVVCLYMLLLCLRSLLHLQSE